MEFFNVLIADDEENIRNGLKCIIDWESIGYKISSDVGNGKDAINQIIDLRPDLVILDIKMPGYTGLDVISKVTDYYEKYELMLPEIIILSGYSDFTYAQTALNSGAKAYLLKPVDEDELQKIVVELHETISKKKHLKNSEENIKTLEEKDFVSKILHSQENITIPEITKYDFFYDCENSNYQVLLFSFDYCVDKNRTELQKSILSYFSFFTSININTDNKLILILKTTNQPGVINCIERSAKLNDNRTFITVGDSLQGLEGLKQSYKQAINLEKSLYFISSHSYISSSFLTDTKIEYSKTDLLNFVDKFVFCIEVYDKKQLDVILSEIQNTLCNVQKDIADVKKDLIFCLVELRNKLINKYPERDISDGNTFDVVGEILNKKSFQEAFSYFKLALNNFIENFNFNTSDSIIVKVIAYIKSNYSSDLKLENLGDMFNCNSAYLGKKFKKYTGVQFNAYLDNIRIEVAKDKLINSDLKIYQISKLVGYANTDYFFMKFKKSTGVTPKEFKKQVEDEKNNH